MGSSKSKSKTKVVAYENGSRSKERHFVVKDGVYGAELFQEKESEAKDNENGPSPRMIQVQGKTSDRQTSAPNVPIFLESVNQPSEASQGEHSQPSSAPLLAKSSDDENQHGMDADWSVVTTHKGTNVDQSTAWGEESENVSKSTRKKKRKISGSVSPSPVKIPPGVNMMTQSEIRPGVTAVTRAELPPEVDMDTQATHNDTRMSQDLLRGLEEQNNQLRRENDDLKSELFIAKEQAHNKTWKQPRVESESVLLAEIQKLQADNDDLRNRLSAAASARLMDGNPNIADLSDQNRPNKLGEHFRLLYGDVWTYAFDDLTKYAGYQEQAACTAIYNIVTKIYSHCYQKSTSQMTKLEKALKRFTGKHKLEDDIRLSIKTYKERRKQNYEEFLPELLEDNTTVLAGALPSKNDRMKGLQRFIQRCTELCWLMCIQDPPVAMVTSCDLSLPFDAELYTPYTSRGSHIDFLVWPPLLLHQGGPRLTVGVAQGIGTETDHGKPHKKKKKKGLIENIRNEVTIDETDILGQVEPTARTNPVYHEKGVDKQKQFSASV